MYAREVNGQTLNFAVSGLLWQSSLVMIDQETQSLWSHLIGAAMQGQLEGAELEVMPSAMTDWRSWRSRHEGTTVAMMSKTADVYRRSLHLNEQPLPTYPLPDALVIGVASDSATRCWRFDSLREELVINDRFDDKNVAAVFDAASGTATVFSREVNGQELTLTILDGKLLDEKTQSEWDAITGQALDEAHKGQFLQKLPGIVSLKEAWLVFHPETTVWAGE